MPGSIRIFQVSGIEIRIHFSWILIFLLVTASLASGVLPSDWSEPKQLLVAGIAALLFFASVLAHELAHALVARQFHMSVSSITLFLLGGVANLTREPATPRAEFSMAIAGPLTSLAIGGTVYGLQQIAARTLDPVAMNTLTPVTGYLATVNVAVAIFNLVPGFPLDGGRVLRSIVWALRRDRAAATKIAARGGEIVAGGIALIGGALLLFGDGFGLWYLLIAYFLFDMARTSLAQERISTVAGGVKVGQLMTTDLHTVAPGLSLTQVVREVLLPHRLPAAIVAIGEQVEGVVTLEDVHGVAQDRWSTTSAGAVMTPASRLPTITPDQDLLDAIQRFGDLPLLPVVGQIGLVGILYLDRVGAYLETRLALGFDRRPLKQAI